MIDTRHVDLSIPNNQKRLITTFCEFFTTEELESLNISKLTCPADGSAIKACHGMEIEENFTDASFQIKCILDTSTVPPTHHVRLEFIKDEMYKMNVECNTSIQNPFYMSAIVTQSINFSKYRSSKDPHYNKRSIIENTAKRIAKIMPNPQHINFFRESVLNNLYVTKKYKEDDLYFEDHNGDFGIHIFQTYHNILRGEFFSKTDKDYVYVPQTDMGINSILLGCEKAIICAKENALDSDRFI